MRPSVSLKNGLTCIATNALPKVGVGKERPQSASQIFDVVRSNEPAILAVTDHFSDPLIMTADRRSTGRHRLQINAAEAFVGTRQCKQRAFPHQSSDVGA